MRKVFLCILVAITLIALAACDLSGTQGAGTQITGNPSSQSPAQDNTLPPSTEKPAAPETQAPDEEAESTEAPTAPETQAPDKEVDVTEKPTVPETQAPEQKEDATGMRPEFKEAMDKYEAFYNDYCDIMQKYSENPMDMTLLTEYSNLMAKAVEVDEAFEKWGDEDLTNEELKYYLEVNTRVMQKMLDVAG